MTAAPSEMTLRLAAQTDTVDTARQKMFAAMDKAGTVIPAAVDRLELAAGATKKTATETSREVRVKSGKYLSVPPAKPAAASK